MDLQNNASFAYLEYLFSEECVASLVHGVLLLYLVVNSALDCYSYW